MVIIATALNSRQQNTTGSDNLLYKPTTFGKLDEVTLIEHLKSVSDLTQSDLESILARDVDQLSHLLERDTNLPPGLIINPMLHVRPVVLSFLKTLSIDHGGQLSDVKAKGGLGKDFDLQWQKVGAYAFEIAAGVITKITFRNGDVGNLMGEKINPVVWKCRCNYSDWRASFENAPLKSKPLHLFFMSAKTGPYKGTKPYTSKCKEYVAKALLHKQCFDRHATAVTATASDRVVQKVKEIKSAKRGSSMVLARAAAKTKAAKRVDAQSFVVGA
jgi:hypothetical protein